MASWSRLISALWGGLASRNGGFSPKSCSASSRAIIAASPRCISRRAMCQRRIPSRILRRRCARSVRKSTVATPLKSRWRICWACCSRSPRLFDMATRTELVLLQKTMVVVEGVSRTLDPNFDMWHVAEPVIREWIERNLGPIGKIEEAGRGCRHHAACGRQDAGSRQRGRKTARRA